MITTKKPDLLLDQLEAYPIIAAVRDEKDIAEALASPVKVIFLINGTLSNIRTRISQIKESGKVVFVHMEMISGLSKDQAAVEFLHMEMKPTGILTTKPNLTQKARSLGLITIQRLFMLDSLSIQTGIKMVNVNRPDLIEIMPAILPKVILRLKKESTIPIIAGGMVESKEEIIDLLKVGATAVSTSKSDLWYL
ncbi:MAG TPA: glycerol-3-phosphate responsive antiterminator [Firmicutes bacterium]|nr:glycerol-3-phosphate responsive antiterminator [Bacillota bacterium]